MVQIIILIIGIVGLVKGEIKVSSKQKLTGRPMKGLSIFYIVAAILMFFLPFIQSALRITTESLSRLTYLGVAVGIIVLVTLGMMIFAKKEPVGVNDKVGELDKRL